MPLVGQARAREGEACPAASSRDCGVAGAAAGLRDRAGVVLAARPQGSEVTGLSPQSPHELRVFVSSKTWPDKDIRQS